MPYTGARYIAYHVPTAALYPEMPGGMAAGAGYPCGDDPGAVADIPIPDPKGAKFHDAYVRLRRFARAVDIAHSLVAEEMDDDDATLKIFMAPEFYFRPPEYDDSFDHSTYPYTHFNYIVDALDGMFTAKRFKNWLIVAGTVLWNTKHQQDPQGLYFNTMIRVEGGKSNALSILEKRHPSQLDGMPQVGPPAKDAKYRIFHESWKSRSLGVFNVGGTGMGAEICLDHLDDPQCRTLRQTIYRWYHQTGNPAPEIKLHLLPCGGMTIADRSVSATPGGFILRNDGLAQSTDTKVSEVRQVTDYLAADKAVLDTPSGTARYGWWWAFKGSENTVTFSNAAMQVPPLSAAPNGKSYYTFKQGLALYRKLRLP